MILNDLLLIATGAFITLSGLIAIRLWKAMIVAGNEKKDAESSKEKEIELLLMRHDAEIRSIKDIIGYAKSLEQMDEADTPE